MSLSSSHPATSAAVPAPDHPPDNVPNFAAAFDQSSTRCVPSPPSADGPCGMPVIRMSCATSTARDTSEPSDCTTATLQHTLESERTSHRPLFAPQLRRIRRPRPSTITTFQQPRHYVRLASSDQH
ncbi:hypothetical protein HPB52_021471 [Rhipicephalus sanguineus]|uniref:Uncharacterized protein n=1 Tax=Rhipicephalus sanguineus TaxID=34632 RepID=A0A9D4QGY8_RHISA|nr:hypothetical protein HPB52_021471 [Rhipicephalus sanguineus]